MKAKLNSEKKKRGDVVEISHPALAFYLIDAETEELVTKEVSIDELRKIEDLLDNEAVIVETDLDFIFKCHACKDDHHHDCTIYYPHNNKTYITSQNNYKKIKK